MSTLVPTSSSAPQSAFLRHVQQGMFAIPEPCPPHTTFSSPYGTVVQQRTKLCTAHIPQVCCSGDRHMLAPGSTSVQTPADGRCGSSASGSAASKSSCHYDKLATLNALNNIPHMMMMSVMQVYYAPLRCTTPTLHFSGYRSLTVTARDRVCISILLPALESPGLSIWYTAGAASWPEHLACAKATASSWCHVQSAVRVTAEHRANQQE